MAFIVLVYCSGMFVKLFENDSAQFAVMAMRMVQENDFLSLFKGTEEYLDKPHMHYWLAALSYKIFGINEWAYRIPGILATLFGAYSCFGLGRLLYNKEIGKLAALIFMTSQTIMLAAIDVRTDAVLTGFTIFAIWQLAAYIETRTVKNIVLGAMGAGIAFSTKGQIALVVIGLPILCHIAYTRNWKRFLSWKLLVALLVFALIITPLLYAYYHQFDLHPEKVIRGKSNRSGIFFIFWEQSFERLSGEGVGKNSSDYLFFFHTFLWVFLPWTILGIMAFWKKIKVFFHLKFKYVKKYEFLTTGGIALIFILISFAQFKLPHYLNIIIPLFAVLTAAYIYEFTQATNPKYLKLILGFQYFVLGLVCIVALLICFTVFPLVSTFAIVLLVLALAVVIYYASKRESYIVRVVTLSVLASLVLNGVLNLHFYPSLLNYQAGSSMAETVSLQDIPADNIYKLTNEHTWALDFYNQEPVKITSLENLKTQKNIWLYINDKQLLDLRQKGYDWDRQYSHYQFRITRLQAKFLDPAKRKKVLKKRHLVHFY